MTSPLDRLTTALANRYRLDRELGSGGMATVYLAHDRKHDRPVAIKVLRDDVAASVGRERFPRQIQLAAKLSHPHIQAFCDSGDVDGTLAAAPRVLAIFGRYPLLLAGVVRAYVLLGDRRRAEAVYAELKARTETDIVVGSSLALLADALGYVDEAIEWALAPVRRCDCATPFWTRLGLTMSDALRTHARHPELLQAMGL